MCLQTLKIFHHDQIGDFLKAGYNLNDLDFLHDNRLPNNNDQQTPMKMHAPKEITIKNENELQISNNSENKMPIENKNCMNVDMETPIIKKHVRMKLKFLNIISIFLMMC